VSTPDTDTKSWSPRWVKVLLVVVTLALLALGALHLLGRASTARWQRYAGRPRRSAFRKSGLKSLEAKALTPWDEHP
jgi:ABC-type uncharacterized transport system YnjBCD permease subunit